MKTNLKVLLTTCMVFCWAFTVCMADEAELRKQIQENNEKMIKAAIAGNAEESLSLYADDIISLPNYSGMMRGKEALRQHDKESREAGFKIHEMKLESIEVKEHGDLVYEVGRFNILLTAPGMPEQVTDKGKYLTLWEKQSDGSLKVKVEMWNTDQNPWMAMQQQAEP